jgi:methionyl-tRNA formyltransferase
MKAAYEPRDIRICFMGTPSFAVAALEALLGAGMQVTGVVTSPDKPAGRGKKLSMPAVKEFAIDHSLPFQQPENLQDPMFLHQMQAWKPDLIIVVAFRKLPEEVWKLPPLGTINLHASLLPQYRGAAPINWAIIHGEKETGITTFVIDEKIDTGRIIAQKRILIREDDTAGSLHDRMMVEGGRLMVETVKLLCSGKYLTMDQKKLEAGEQPLRKAPKIFKDDGRIRWNRKAEEIHNLVRGLCPLPGAWTILKNSDGQEFNLKIYRTRITDNKMHSKPGTLCLKSKTILVTTADGCLEIIELQLEGRKRMHSAEFLKGFPLEGAVFIS